MSNDYGVTYSGFVMKRLETLKKETDDLLRSTFGTNINLTSASVFSQLEGISIYVWSRLWELAADVHACFDPAKAYGESLDAIGEITHTPRHAAEATVVMAAVCGEPGDTIPAGVQASNKDTQDVYTLKEPVTVDAAKALIAWVKVVTIAAETNYMVSLDGTSYTIGSGSSPSGDSILTDLRTVINAGSQATAVFDGGMLKITTASTLPLSVSVSDKLVIQEAGSLGMFTAAETGPKLCPAGALSEIHTPHSNWSRVENLRDGVTGRDREKDEEYRIRRKKNVNITAQHTIDSIYSRLTSLFGVRDTRILQNVTDETDELGIPGHSVWIIVQGGIDEEIAQAIYSVIPVGIGMHGGDTVEVKSQVTDQVYDITFDRPDEIHPYIDVTIMVTDEDAMPPNVILLIKDALVAYGQSEQFIGDDLVYNRLFVPIYSVPGFKVTSLYIGTGPDPTGMSNIEANVNQLIEITAQRIEVTIEYP